jgi:hypothetical protein
MREPHLGAPVHYVSYGSQDGTYPSTCRAAQITEVGAWVVESTDEEPYGPPEAPVRGTRRTVVERYEPRAAALVVHNPTGIFLPPACEYHDGDVFSGSGGVRYTPGTWHWPHE